MRVGGGGVDPGGPNRERMGGCGLWGGSSVSTGEKGRGR